MGDTGVTLKERKAAWRRDVTTMLWVDHQSYFGSDRRVKTMGLRLKERRRMNCANSPPHLSTALRQLRMRVLDAHGPGAKVFADRAQGCAALADMNHEHDTADALSAMAIKAARWSGGDLRPTLYTDLDRAHAALRTYH
jgi:hypothetical protein